MKISKAKSGTELRGKRWFGVCFMGLVLMTGGCGSKFPKTVPVTGKLTVDGKPIEGVAISLMPDNGGRFGYGTTDAEGSFSISTFGVNDGATLGTHKILVTKAEIVPPNRVAATIEEQDELTREGVAGWKMKSLISEKYGKPDTTDLSVKVEEGLKPLLLEISSK